MDASMMALIESYFVDEALILIPVLWILGYFLKQSEKIANWIIVWILLVLGIIGGIALVGVDANGVIQGILVAGASVLGHQLIKQTKEQ